MVTTDTRKALNTAGLRATNQRALILNIIRKGQGHLGAEKVHRRAQRKQPRLSLSTVYRTLQVFKKLGLVEETHLDETHRYYEMKPPTQHYHLICLDCGQVIEFEYPLARLVKRNVAQAKDFEITGSEVRITGYCPKCRQRRGKF